MDLNNAGWIETTFVVLELEPMPVDWQYSSVCPRIVLYEIRIDTAKYVGEKENRRETERGRETKEQKEGEWIRRLVMVARGPRMPLKGEIFLPALYRVANFTMDRLQGFKS